MARDTFDPGDPHTWPVWLREKDIVTEGDHIGPFPASRFQWRKLAPPPIKFGARISCWHRNTVALICALPNFDYPTQQIQQGSSPPASAMSVRKRNGARRQPTAGGPNGEL